MDTQICSSVEVLKKLYFIEYMPIRGDPPHRFSQLLLFDFINKI